MGISIAQKARDAGQVRRGRCELSALYWRLATFAPKDYHRRNYVSLPCSEWERVFPQRQITRT